MSERLTDEQIEGLRQDSIYERMIVGSDVRRLISELRYYKQRVSELEEQLCCNNRPDIASRTRHDILLRDAFAALEKLCRKEQTP